MRKIAIFFVACAVLAPCFNRNAFAQDRRTLIEKVKSEFQNRITNSEDEEYRKLFAANRWPIREYEAVKEFSKSNRDLINLYIDYRQDLDRQKRPQVAEFIIPAWRASREKEMVTMYVDAVLADAEELLKQEKPDLRKLADLNRNLDELFAHWGEKPDRIEKYMSLRKEFSHAEIMFSFQMAGLNSEKVNEYWTLRKEGFESREIMESYRITGGEPMRFMQYWNLRRQGYDAADAKRVLSGRKPKNEPGQKAAAGSSGAKGDVKESAKTGAGKGAPEPLIKRIEWTGEGGKKDKKEEATQKSDSGKDKKESATATSSVEKTKDNDDSGDKKDAEELRPESEKAE